MNTRLKALLIALSLSIAACGVIVNNTSVYQVFSTHLFSAAVALDGDLLVAFDEQNSAWVRNLDGTAAQATGVSPGTRMAVSSMPGNAVVSGEGHNWGKSTFSPTGVFTGSTTLGSTLGTIEDIASGSDGRVYTVAGTLLESFLPTGAATDLTNVSRPAGFTPVSGSASRVTVDQSNDRIYVAESLISASGSRLLNISVYSMHWLYGLVEESWSPRQVVVSGTYNRFMDFEASNELVAVVMSNSSNSAGRLMTYYLSSGTSVQDMMTIGSTSTRAGALSSSTLQTGIGCSRRGGYLYRARPTATGSLAQPNLIMRHTICE